MAANPWARVLADHGAIRRRVRRLRRDLDGPSPLRGAARALSRFALSLRRHLREEETVLYPLGEYLFGGPNGAVSVLREDHAAIGLVLAGMARDARHPSRGALVRKVEVLEAALDVHFAREERVLFPLLQARLSDSELARLVRRLARTVR